MFINLELLKSICYTAPYVGAHIYCTHVELDPLNLILNVTLIRLLVNNIWIAWNFYKNFRIKINVINYNRLEMVVSIGENAAHFIRNIFFNYMKKMERENWSTVPTLVCSIGSHNTIISVSFKTSNCIILSVLFVLNKSRKGCIITYSEISLYRNIYASCKYIQLGVVPNLYLKYFLLNKYNICVSR